MKNKEVSRIMLALLLISMLSLTFNIQPVSINLTHFISYEESLDNSNVGVSNSATYISVPFHYQSKNYYCGPAALEMVFDYYGEDISQTEIADVARTHPHVTYTDELRRAAHFSNLSTSLGNEMPSNISGYSTRKVGYAAFEHYGLTIDDLKTLISKEEPLIVLMWWTQSKVYGHYRVVVGHNDTHIIMHDPWNKDIWGGTYGGANTSMTYSTFLDLWEYSGNWGLLVRPWDIELQMPSTVIEDGDFEVTANVTYSCSAPFDTADYPAYSCKATIELQENLELALGETTQHSLGDIIAGDSVETSWSIHATKAGLHNISVTVTAIIEGSVETHGTCPYYDYEDEIGGLSIGSLSVAIQTLKVHNLNTDLNYTTIQEAINAPETVGGHTIFVEEGTYYEHVVVDKSLSLIGENSETTTIDGNSTGNVLETRTDNVSIINFTIRNSGKIWGPPPGHGYPNSGVFGNSVRNIRIENNTVVDAAVCIWFSACFNISITYNTVLDGFYAGVVGYTLSNSTIYCNLVDGCGSMGLHLDGNSVYCKVADNTVTNNLEGIELERSAGNLVEGNHLLGNNVSIVLNECTGLNVFRGNNIAGYMYNLIVWGWSIEAFMQDIDTSNFADNKKVYYLTNAHDLLINPYHYPNLGYLALVNCTDITVSNIDLSFNRDGMLLAQSMNCTLTNITISGNHGVLLHGGLTFFRSTKNLIVNNRISNNSVGISLYQSHENAFYHNSFVDNNRHVVSNFHSPFAEPAGSYSINKWDDGYPSGGNYWRDYADVDLNSGPYQNETGSDGIWDHPYVIDVYNKDNYPLVKPWSPAEVTSATIDIDPDTLNLKSRGRWITAHVELPECYGASYIDRTTILLNDTIPVDLFWADKPLDSVVGDHDEDGIPDLMVKFNRAEVIELIFNAACLSDRKFDYVTLTLTGQLTDGTPFGGSDTIRIGLPYPSIH